MRWEPDSSTQSDANHTVNSWSAMPGTKKSLKKTSEEPLDAECEGDCAEPG